MLVFSIRDSVCSSRQKVLAYTPTLAENLLFMRFRLKFFPLRSQVVLRQ